VLWGRRPPVLSGVSFVIHYTSQVFRFCCKPAILIVCLVTAEENKLILRCVIPVVCRTIQTISYMRISSNTTVLGIMIFTICKAQLHVSATNVGHLQFEKKHINQLYMRL
jgi:hypothetical protein